MLVCFKSPKSCAIVTLEESLLEGWYERGVGLVVPVLADDVLPHVQVVGVPAEPRQLVSFEIEKTLYACSVHFFKNFCGACLGANAIDL